MGDFGHSLSRHCLQPTGKKLNEDDRRGPIRTRSLSAMGASLNDDAIFQRTDWSDSDAFMYNLRIGYVSAVQHEIPWQSTLVRSKSQS